MISNINNISFLSKKQIQHESNIKQQPIKSNQFQPDTVKLSTQKSTENKKHFKLPSTRTVTLTGLATTAIIIAGLVLKGDKSFKEIGQNIKKFLFGNPSTQTAVSNNVDELAHTAKANISETQKNALETGISLLAEHTSKNADETTSILTKAVDNGQPIIDVIDEHIAEKVNKLKPEQLEILTDELVQSADNITDKAIRAEESFVRHLNADNKEQAVKYHDEAIRIMKENGDDKAAEIFEHTYESKKQKLLNPEKVKEETQKAMDEAKVIKEKLEAHNKAIREEAAKQAEAKAAQLTDAKETVVLTENPKKPAIKEVIKKEIKVSENAIKLEEEARKAISATDDIMEKADIQRETFINLLKDEKNPDKALEFYKEYAKNMEIEGMSYQVDIDTNTYEGAFEELGINIKDVLDKLRENIS